jgi:hypothetical protein
MGAELIRGHDEYRHADEYQGRHGDRFDRSLDRSAQECQ